MSVHCTRQFLPCWVRVAVEMEGQIGVAVLERKDQACCVTHLSDAADMHTEFNSTLQTGAGLHECRL